jgi:biotin carboxyl carrier protein
MTHEYAVQVGATAGAAKESAPRHVLVEQLGAERFRVVIDGAESIVSARRVEAAAASATYSLVDESQVEARAIQRVVDVDAVDGSRGELRVIVSGGEPMAVTVGDLRDQRSASGEQHGGGPAGELRAAMPGKVVKLLCKPGDEVKAGQSLMIIEAMKMENELRSPSAGRVAEVATREGQTVEAGQLLLNLAPI